MAFRFYENVDEFRQAIAEIARFNDEYIKSLESRDFNEVLRDLFGADAVNAASGTEDKECNSQKKL